MDSRINYSLVGGFVLVLAAATIGFGYWLFVGGSDRQYQPFVVYATDSVSGLNANARVYYHGVDVGSVDRIQIDPSNPDRIEIRVSIAEGTPIRQDTTAQLRPQGVTGLSVLDLSGGTPDSPILTDVDQSCCPVIRYEPSLFSKLEGGLQDTLVHISVIGQRLERLLSEDNVDALQTTIKDISEITTTVANERETITRIVKNTEQTTENTAKLTASADRFVDRAHGSMDQIEQAIAELTSTMSHFSDAADQVAKAADSTVAFTAAGTSTAQQIDRRTLPEIELLVADLRGLTRRVSALTNTIDDDPSQIIFGSPKRPAGPGEEQ